MKKHLAPSGPLPLLLLVLPTLTFSRLSPHHPRRVPGGGPGAPRPLGLGSQPAFRPARLPRHVPRAPWGRATSWAASARALWPLARLGPPVASRKGVQLGLGGEGGGGGGGRAAAGSGRCPFKVPPPRGRETACASPIPPGSARNKKHNA